MHSSSAHRELSLLDRVDHLLIAAPNWLTQDRLWAMLAGGGIIAAESPLGLRVDCRGIAWGDLLESLSLALSPMERRDTRVALIARACDEITERHAVFCSRSVEALLEERTQRWVAEMIASDRIRIDIQPIVQHPPGRLHGYECLMRGQDENGEVIAPGRVFAAAERLGLVPELEQRCRSAAIRAAGEVFREVGDRSISFFINFIPSTVVEPMTVLRDIIVETDRAGLEPSQVTFEVVETDKVEDTRRLMTILRYFRKAGFKIALDDVGAGYASLLSLSTLRPDYIKLDGELVRRAASSALEGKLVADLAQTARQNGILPIAEGIETEAEFRFAAACGVRLTQGYYHARPGPRALSAVELGEALRRAEEAGRGSAERGTAAAA